MHKILCLEEAHVELELFGFGSIHAFPKKGKALLSASAADFSSPNSLESEMFWL